MKGSTAVWIVVGLGLAVAAVVAVRSMTPAPAPVAPQWAPPVAQATPGAPKPGVAEQVAGYIGLGLNVYGQGHAGGLW